MGYMKFPLWSERTCKYMWPLTPKHSLGMNARQANARQAHGWETDSRGVRNGSGERMHGWKKFLHGCSQTETWLTKILNGCSRTDTRVTRLGRQDGRLVVWCAKYFWILSVSDSVHIQCIILRSRKSFATLRAESPSIFLDKSGSLERSKETLLAG